MLKGLVARLEDSLTVALVISVGVGPSPGCSAAALGLLLAYRIADKYFHDSFFDENRNSINRLAAEFAKLKEKQNHVDLKGAFGGKSGL